MDTLQLRKHATQSIGKEANASSSSSKLCTEKNNNAQQKDNTESRTTEQRAPPTTTDFLTVCSNRTRNACATPTTKTTDIQSAVNVGGETVVVHRKQQKPQVPPKPQIDIVRYSMANAKDDMDLDTILQELLELENQLSSDASDQLLLGLPILSNTSSSTTRTTNNKFNSNKLSFPYKPVQQQSTLTRSHDNTDASRRITQYSSLTNVGSNPDCELRTVLNLMENRIPQSVDPCASPDADSAFGDSSSTECSSGSSATSTANHSNHCRNSKISNSDSYRESINTPSPTHQQNTPLITSRFESVNSSINYEPNFSICAIPASASFSIPSQTTNQFQRASSSALSAADIKAQKIREALEKMKEAKMKKIYVKIFLEDGTTKGLLIDERWTVGETMHQLANKLNILLTLDYAIVEEYPDLMIKRIYEDHEFVVENIEDWLAESKNKLYFVRLTEKYNFMRCPEKFLHYKNSNFCFENLQSPLPSFSSFNVLAAPSVQQTIAPEWSVESRQALLKTFLDAQGDFTTDSLMGCSSGAGTSIELEGWLMLKVDGKKSWKKHYFVLRSSGLYYNPKSGKQKYGAKNLQCLMNVYNNQIYTCIDCKKKYKAPTEFGFVIKHPRIQLKTSKYIKYVCAQDEETFIKWVTALRITRNGFKNLYKNYLASQEYEDKQRQRIDSLAAGLVPIRVDFPNISLQRLSSLEANSVSSPISVYNEKVLRPVKPQNETISISSMSIKHSKIDSSLKPQFQKTNLLHNAQHNLSAKKIEAPVQYLNSAQSLSSNLDTSKAVAVADIKRHSNEQENFSNDSEEPQYTENYSKSIVFDQDECGTIKRQPINPTFFNNYLDTGNNIALTNNSPHCRLSLSNNSNNTLQSPLLDNSKLAFPESKQQCLDQQKDYDFDKDEEQLPPPPLQGYMLLTPNSGVSQVNELSPAVIMRPSSTTPRKIPPPPPPKRSEATRVVTSQTNLQQINANIPNQHHQQMGDLFAELQLATAFQKHRIGGN